MSLLLAYTFNEQKTSPWDYSGNKNTGTAHNLTFQSGQNYGYAGNFGQGSSATYISVSPLSFTGLGALTIFSSFNLTSLPAASGAYLINSSSFSVTINSSGTVTFSLHTGTATWTVNSTVSLATGWNTIGAVYDGTGLYIYINGVIASNSSTATGTINNPNTVFIGAASASDSTTYIHAIIDSIEFRNTGLTSTDISNLHGSPGGIKVTQTPHNFAMGDLIADGSMTYKGVVTWVVNTDEFFFYPTSPIGSDYSRLGNIGNSFRQNYMELIDDFDGYGNGQIKWSSPIAGFSDYGKPQNVTTLDYRNKGIGNVAYSFFSETQSRQDTGTTLSTLFNEDIKAGTINLNGEYIKFRFHVKGISSDFTKTVYLDIGNVNILIYTLPTATAVDIYIYGTIKAINIATKAANYMTKIESNGAAPIIADGSVTVDFTKDVRLLLQGKGNATGDITAESGEGEIYTLKSIFN